MWHHVLVLFRRLTLDPAAAELEWLCVSDASEYKVLQYEFRSPLHNKLLGEGRGLQIGIDIVGQPASLDQWCASQAYRHVPEHIQKMLHEKLPGVVESDSMQPWELTMDLMRHADPDMSPGKAEAALRTAVLVEVPVDDKLDQLDLAMAADCGVIGDHETIQEEIVRNTKQTGKRSDFLKRGLDALAKHFKKRPPSAKAKTLDRMLASKHKKPVPNKRRWFAELETDAHAHLDSWKPIDSKIVLDEPNGRWLLSFPNSDRKSVSWTKRGQPAAVREALKWLWERHCAQTGLPCPVPQEFLEF